MRDPHDKSVAVPAGLPHSTAPAGLPQLATANMPVSIGGTGYGEVCTVKLERINNNAVDNNIISHEVWS